MAETAHGIRDALGASRRSLALVIGTAALFSLWELLAHNYLMTLPMDTWHLVSGGVGVGLALLVTALATHSVLVQQRKLKQVVQLREDLTHMVVHDLRTPLTVMIGSLESMRNGIGGEIPPDAVEMTDMALSGSRSLLQLVNNLLDIAKMEAGESVIDPVPTDVRSVVGGALATVLPIAQTRRIDLIQEGAVPAEPVLLDGEKIERMLINLLGNALKFTPAGGRVTLQTAYDEQWARLTFSVSDTGEGIPEEHLGRIFDKFGQVAERKAGRKMSTGLGLTFCKLIAEAHGGLLSVRSRPGEGSTFTVSLPLNTSAARGQSPLNAVASG